MRQEPCPHLLGVEGKGEELYAQMDGCVSRETRWMDGMMGKWMHGWIDGCVDG